jgi:toxin YoeB
MYRIVFTEDAKRDLRKLERKAPKAIAKLEKLIKELQVHPKTGTGHIELLKHYKEETWSRRINHEHRLVYRIHEDTVEVLVISTYGHYIE